MTSSHNVQSSPQAETALACLIEALKHTLDLLPTASLRADTPLRDVGMDSLARILVSDQMESHGWRMSESAASGAHTIGELAERVTRG